MAAVPLKLNRAHEIEAHVEIGAQGSEGILASPGTELGGWSLFVKDGRAHYVHNLLKIQSYRVSSQPLRPGAQRIRFAFTSTGQGKGLGQLFVNDVAKGDAVASGTAPYIYSAVQEGLQIGRQWGPPVSGEYYDGPFEFTGVIERVVMRLPERKKAG